MEKYKSTSGGLHPLYEETEEPRLLQTLEKFALDPAWTDATYGAALWLGIVFFGLAWFYLKKPEAITDPLLSQCMFPLLFLLGGPLFGYGLHGTAMLRRRLREHHPDIKYKKTQNEPTFQPSRTEETVYEVNGRDIAKSRQPKTVKFGPNKHTFSGNDLDRLEIVYLGGDPGIRRDTSAAGWGWTDSDSGLSNITSTNFGIVKNVLLHKEYAEQRGQACVWTEKGLREILELDFDPLP